MASQLAARTDRGECTIGGDSGNLTHSVVLFFVGAAIFLGTIFAPPSLMDDVDAVNGQIARNMLDSGDWVTARINGVAYLEKSPLGFWLMAASYKAFGVHDWAARLPGALGAIALMFLTAALGRWGFGPTAGFSAGLAVGANVGLFLFTRIVIPDVLLTLSVAAALYCFLRAIEAGARGEEKGRWWAWGYWASIGIGMLLKGLLAAVVPVATGLLYLLVRRELLDRRTWRALRPLSGAALTLALYLPWVALATLRNPPVFDLTMRSEPGVYRGFLWFYFINEHVLRFLNRRFPRDYNTVPRLQFLLLHAAWLFPWSVFLPAAARGWGMLGHEERARQVRLLALLWIVFLLAFLSLSTTQEYYSMPCYPAFAVLAGAALATGPKRWISAGYGVVAGIGLGAAAIAGTILYLVRGVRPVGDISAALTQNPEAYTLSLGHMSDLTLNAFAYLRGPLLLAAAALGIGGAAAWFTRRSRLGPLCLAAMMVLAIHAADQAMGVFDPYMSSRRLAEAIQRGPEGQVILQGHYYPASSVVFYTNHRALLLNGVVDNLVYGAAAPGAPHVFINDADLARLWKEPQRLYLVAPSGALPHYQSLLGRFSVFAEAGGKAVLTNR